MKLISLYIENFGGLSRYALEFDAGITTVVQPNGFGKTTIAEFIRAMFYGFPRKSKTLEKSLRQKYAPWNGGQYGGNLVFEYQGQRYRLERTFGTNPKGDSLTVIALETGKKTALFGEEPGLELFDLDADSFERSTYLPQLREDGPMATASILSKLSDLVEDSTDVGNFDKAVAALRAKRSAMIPYRGSGGSVAELSEKITDLQVKLDAACAQQRQLQAAQEAAAKGRRELEIAQQQLLQTRQELELAAARTADRVHRQQYEQLCGQCRRAEEQIAFYRKKYPWGLPKEESLRRAEIAAGRLREEKPEEAVPTSRQLEHGRLLCGEYEALQRRFSEVQRCAAELIRGETQAPEELRRGVSGKMSVILWVAGAFSLAAGGVLLFMQHMVFTLAAFGVGAMALIAGVVLGCIRRRGRRLREQEARLRRQDLDRKLLNLRQQAQALETAAGNYHREIEAFFAKYGVESKEAPYAVLLAQLEQKIAVSEHRMREKEAARQELRAVFQELNLIPLPETSAQLQQIRRDIRDLEMAEIRLKELSEQRVTMERECGEILLADPGAAVDLRQLKTREQQLHTKITESTANFLQIQQRMQLLQDAVAQIPQLQDALFCSRSELEQQREDVRLLDATIDFLYQAKENLTTAYMGTIRSRFGAYLSMLCEELDEAFFVDPQLQVQLEKQGKARELAYFSAGQTDLVKLCMRLALVDALFKGERVPVILDDPFVNLDDLHMDKARRLMNKLAAEHQILYLTCHSSREI